MAKLLLVEDDNNLREIYQARLSAEGYDIIAAQDGEEALSLAKQHKPDLIISDVMMPRISGFEMLDILRNTDELKNTKVIMLTALGQAEDRSRADNLGADKYLVKSQVTLEDIVTAAKELLSGEGATAPAAVTTVAAADPAPTPVATEPILEAPVNTVQPTLEDAAAEEETPAQVVTPVEPTSIEPTPTGSDGSGSTDTVTAPTADASPITAAATDPAQSASISVADPDPLRMPSDQVQPEPATSIDTSSDGTITDPATDSDATEQQDIAAEEATVQSQIESFANQPSPESSPTPVVEAAQTQEQANTNANDALLANAVEDLTERQEPDEVSTAQSKAFAPAEPVTPPAVAEDTQPEPDAASAVPAEAAPVTTDNDNVTVTGKKVIQPLGEAGAKPDINELFAKEEALEQAAAPTVEPTPVIDGQPQPRADTTVQPVQKPSLSFDPNKIAL